MSIFYNMLHRLSSDDAEKQYLLAPAVSYLEKNYKSTEITNGFLAGLCNISEVYFRKLFIKTYGVTRKQFVIDMRISKAMQLLDGRDA